MLNARVYPVKVFLQVGIAVEVVQVACLTASQLLRKLGHHRPQDLGSIIRMRGELIARNFVPSSEVESPRVKLARPNVFKQSRFACALAYAATVAQLPGWHRAYLAQRTCRETRPFGLS